MLNLIKKIAMLSFFIASISPAYATADWDGVYCVKDDGSKSAAQQSFDNIENQLLRSDSRTAGGQIGGYLYLYGRHVNGAGRALPPSLALTNDSGQIVKLDSDTAKKYCDELVANCKTDSGDQTKYYVGAGSGLSEITINTNENRPYPVRGCPYKAPN